MIKSTSHKKIGATFATALVCVVPFFYNSCQKFQAAANSTNSLLGVGACKYMVENGRIKAMSTADTNSPFANQKVLLSPQPISGTSKAQVQPSVVKQGTSLSVILDNNCLHQNSNRSDFISAVLGQAQPRPDMPSQAYTYILPQDESSIELESLADQEACVVGISWNRTYHTQSNGVSFNDPMFGNQIHLSAINAPNADALFYSQPNGMPTSGGTPVKVAVIDTGIDYNHPDLQSNIYTFSNGWGIDITTFNGSTASFNPMDVSPIGHGTHVSGLIAAVSNNGVGVVGAMPFDVKIMAVKIFTSDGQGGVTTTTTDFYNGIMFAIANDADVINLSVEASGTQYDSVAQSGLQQAVASGIPVAVAMGNGNPTGQLVDGINVHVVPAVYSTIKGVIGVASINADTGSLSSFSNYGTAYAEIAAPGAASAGMGMTSTVPLSLSSYGQLSGTSQATPLVAAAEALMIGWIKKAYGGTAPSPAAVESLILGSADSSSQLLNYIQNGRRLNLLNEANAILSQYPQTQPNSTGTSTALPPPIGCATN